MTARKPPPAMLTVREVAVLLRVAKDTVYDLISRGELQAGDIGHGKARTRISEDDYRAYVDRITQARKTA